MLSRVVGMLSKSYDKSAEEVYCTSEGEHGLAVSSDRTVASSQASEPVSRLSAKTSNDRKSFNVRLPSRIISLCGGGHLCIAHVGVLKALEEKNLLKYIKGVVGISAGALVGLILILGYTVEQIERLLYGIDLSIFTSVEADSALLFYQSLCVNSGNVLETFLTSLLEAKGLSSDVTFASLYTNKSRPFFRCYATRLHTSDIQEFSLEKTPNHSILFAVRASMCLPVVFAPMKDPFTGILYYDAGLVHNMPFVFLTEEEKEQCLCVFFNIFDMGADISTLDPITIFKYAFKSFYNTRNVYFLKRFVDRIISIPVDFTKLLDCNTKDAKDGLIRLGHEKCMSLLDSVSTRIIARRYSVT
jgi:predicted acylesterase/phospholipase RssA